MTEMMALLLFFRKQVKIYHIYYKLFIWQKDEQVWGNR